MDLRSILKKTKSPTYAELLADRGHPGPNVSLTFISDTTQY